MFLKYLSAAIVAIVVLTHASPVALAQASPDPRAEAIKREVVRLSAGSSKIEIKMKDGTKLKGPVTQILDDSFDITDAKSKRLSTLPYREVSSVKKPGWSTGAKVALGVGIGAVVTAAVIAGIVGKKGLSGFCPLGCGTMLRP